MLNAIVREYAMYYMLITIIMKTLISHIMVIPKDRTDTFLMYKPMELIFTKGDENALDIVLFYESVQFYTLLVERYSCIYDLFYLITIRIITHLIPMYVVIIFCYSMSLITYSEFARISNPITYYYVQTEMNVHLIMLYNQIQVIMAIIFHVCQKKNYNQTKVFGGVCLISYFTRAIVMVGLQIKGETRPLAYEQLVNSNPLCMLYVPALAYAACSKIIKIDVKPLYLFNNFVKTKFHFILNKQQKQLTEGLAISGIIVLLYFDVCVERSEDSKLLVKALFKFVYKFIQMSLICYLHVVYALDHTEYKPISYKNLKARLLQNQTNDLPGYDFDNYMYLGLIPVSSFILKYVQSTIMGPYHALFLLLVVLGVLGSCIFTGVIIQLLYYWAMRNMLIFVTDVFNDLKKQHIRQLIRENIYNRDYATDVELKKKQDEQKMKDQIEKIIDQ